MKTKILIIGFILAAACASACSKHDLNSGINSQPEEKHPPMDHSRDNHGETMNHSEMKSSPNAADAPYDLQFLDTMIAHHQGAVDMARPAASRAQHSELKTLAQNIVANQEKEIAQMKKWRDEWFTGKAAAINMEMAGMTDSMKGMDMKKLESSNGKDFDLEFIKQMIPHHEGAVVMAKEALRKSQKEEIKSLANAIIKDQETEIRQMNEWLTAWNK